jgi:hypothetical protein
MEKPNSHNELKPRPDSKERAIQMSEDEEDLAAFEERNHEPTMSYKELLSKLELDTEER